MQLELWKTSESPFPSVGAAEEKRCDTVLVRDLVLSASPSQQISAYFTYFSVQKHFILFNKINAATIQKLFQVLIVFEHFEIHIRFYGLYIN